MVSTDMLRSMDANDYNVVSEENSKEIALPKKLKIKKKSSKDAT